MGTTRGLGDLKQANRLYARAMSGRKYEDITREDWRRVWQRRPVNGTASGAPALPRPQAQIEVRQEPSRETGDRPEIRTESPDLGRRQADNGLAKPHGPSGPVHTAANAEAALDTENVDGYAVWKQFIRTVEKVMSAVRPPSAPVAMGSAARRHEPESRECLDDAASERRDETPDSGLDGESLGGRGGSGGAGNGRTGIDLP